MLISVTGRMVGNERIGMARMNQAMEMLPSQPRPRWQISLVSSGGGNATTWYACHVRPALSLALPLVTLR